MPDTQLERVAFQVPIDTGHLIGNTLRQYAMRGTNTWQPAAYRLAGKEGSFGLGGGFPFSSLELIRGHLVSSDVKFTVPEKLCKFERNGEEYICEDMRLLNLGKLGAPSIDVCLVYASGARTASQNYAVAKRLCPQDVQDFVSVPSKHTPTVTFRYEVTPYDQNSETLCVFATPGCVKLAREAAVKSLSGLHI